MSEKELVDQENRDINETDLNGSMIESPDLYDLELIKKTGTKDIDLALSLLVKTCGASFEKRHQDIENMKLTFAAINEIGPKDAVDGMLTSQMVSCHFQALNYMEKALNEYDISIKEKCINLSTKLLRSFRLTLDALEKRRGSVQQLKIERINLNDGAQAIVGNINQQEGKKHIQE